MSVSAEAATRPLGCAVQRINPSLPRFGDAILQLNNTTDRTLIAGTTFVLTTCDNRGCRKYNVVVKYDTPPGDHLFWEGPSGEPTQWVNSGATCTPFHRRATGGTVP